MKCIKNIWLFICFFCISFVTSFAFEIETSEKVQYIWTQNISEYRDNAQVSLLESDKNIQVETVVTRNYFTVSEGDFSYLDEKERAEKEKREKISLYSEAEIFFMQKLWKEKFTKLFQKWVLKIFGSENHCAENIDQFDVGTLWYADCFLEKKSYKKNVSTHTLYKIDANIPQKWTFRFYPKTYKYPELYVWNTEFFSKKFVKLTLFDATAEIYNLRASSSTHTNLSLKKKYNLVTVKQANETFFQLFPYYEFSVDLEKWENFIELSYDWFFRKSIDEKTGETGILFSQ